MTRRSLLLLLLAALLAPLSGATTAHADSYVPISGAGSTWSQNALDQWRRNVTQYGLQVNYQGTGSSDGRNQFRNGTVDFAVSEIPYGLKDQGVVDNPPTRNYAYMPIVAGGTSFMYNLKIGGQRVKNLRLSGENITKIFTAQLTMWNDPAIAKDNPGLQLPARRIVPVVRSDGSGTTAQFTLWMSKRYQGPWDAYCKQAGIDSPCGLTSTYPVVPGKGFTALSGSLGVSGYVAQSQSEGAITYVEYSYALNTGFPVVKVLNDAGYYTSPTAENVAVALLKARINSDKSSPAYLTQILDDVYAGTDPRTYPLSSYSYMIVPTKVEGSFSTSKGKTLGDFGYYFLCEGQQQAPVLGYSPLPINLVKAGLEQVKNIPGVDVQKVDISKCNNPTFSADGKNTLADKAPMPQPCDKQGPTQCGSTTQSQGGSTGSTSTGGSSTSGGSTSGSTGSGTSGGTTGGTGTSGAGATGGSAGTTGTVVGGASTGALVPGVVDAAGNPVPSGAVDAAGNPVVAGNGAQLGGGTTTAIPVSVSESLGAGTRWVLGAMVVLALLGVAVGPAVVTRRAASGDPS